MDPLVTPILVTILPWLKVAAAGLVSELGRGIGRSLSSQLRQDRGYERLMWEHWQRQEADREEHSKRVLEFLREWQAGQIELKLTEIQTLWDRDHWFSKLSRQETVQILRHRRTQYRLLILASLPKISRRCPESLREDLPLELPDKLGRFLSEYYPPHSALTPVEFYGDYFKEPISDIDVRRLQEVLGPVPTAILYSNISDYEVSFHVGSWSSEDRGITLYSPPAWNWEAANDALLQAGQNETRALRAIRQAITAVHQLLAGFVIDWHYLQVNPTHEPQLFQVVPAFEQKGLASVLQPPLEVLQELKQERLEAYHKEMARLAREQQPGRVFRDRLQDGSPGPEMVVLPAGSFLMGSPAGEGDDDERPQHRVTIAKPFAIGRYPVTFEEYDRFAEATARERPGDDGWGRGRRPVIHVSWHEAVAYAEWLSKQTGEQYRLATEAEWEYACRASSTTRWYYGDKEADLGEYAWYSHNAEGKTHPVGQKKANAWGLYDMHGNVWEWCRDGLRDYRAEPVVDPVGPEDPGAERVIRGGSWNDSARLVRAASRDQNPPGNRLDDLGFRCARVQA